MNHRPSLLALALCLLLSPACGNSSSSPGPEPSPPSEMERPPAPPEAAEPVAFRIDPSAGGLSASESPADGARLMASGPPGGPLYVRIVEVEGEEIDDAALRALVEAQTSAEHDQPVQLGAAAQVELAGGPRAALAAITGQSMARTVRCYVLLAAPGTGRSLLTEWGVAAGDSSTPDCTAPLSHPSLQPVAASFALE